MGFSDVRALSTVLFAGSLFFAACDARGDAAWYQEAVASPSLPEALLACKEIAGAGARGDCQVLSRTRFDNFSSCEDVEPGLWHEECLFLQAEHVAAGGDYMRALRICQNLSFARECDDHVLGAMAFSYADRPIEEIAAAWLKAKELSVGPAAEMQVWRSWIRERLNRGLDVEVSKCPRRTCTVAAERETELMVMKMIYTDGCPPPTPSWGTSGEGGGLYQRAFKKLCPGATAK